jgi:hypothetical protein
MSSGIETYGRAPRVSRPGICIRNLGFCGFHARFGAGCGLSSAALLSPRLPGHFYCVSTKGGPAAPLRSPHRRRSARSLLALRRAQQTQRSSRSKRCLRLINRRRERSAAAIMLPLQATRASTAITAVRVQRGALSGSRRRPDSVPSRRLPAIVRCRSHRGRQRCRKSMCMQ